MGAPWKGPNRIPNAPVREAFLASRMTASEVCRALGWTRYDTGQRADTTLLKRTLGLHPTRNLSRTGEVYYSTYTTVSITNARAICEALSADFDALYDGLLPEVKSAGRCSCGEPMMWPADRCGFCESPVDRAERAMWQEAA